MDRLSLNDSDRLARVIDGISGFFDSKETLLLAVSDAINKIIAWDTFSYCELDLAQFELNYYYFRPCDISVERYMDVYRMYCIQDPAMIHIINTYDRQSLMFSDFLSENEQGRLPLFTDFNWRIGWRHKMTFMTGQSAAAMTAMGISRDKRDFTERDRLMLNLISPHIRTALKALNARDNANAPKSYLLIASADGRIKWAREEALKLLRERSLIRQCGRNDILPDVILERLTAVAKASSEKRVENIAHVCRETKTTPVAEISSLKRIENRSILSSFNISQNDGDIEVVCRLGAQPDEMAVVISVKDGFYCPPLIAWQKGLTMRESEVLYWIAQGKSNEDIAEILSISKRTVKKHLERIYPKLGVENRASAAAKVWSFLTNRRTID